MTQDTTNNYKITMSIEVHVLPYMEEDEYIHDCVCVKTLPECKQYLLERLTYLQNRVDKLTMKQIKEGVKLV